MAIRVGAVEGLVTSFWKGRRVLLTGHTGFKGGWLSIWLRRLGAEVAGYSLPAPTEPSLWQLAKLEQLVNSVTGDVRDLKALTRVVTDSQAEIVFHLAAQPLVLGGYSDPVGTFDTNVIGTVNLLQAVRSAPAVGAVVVVTSDKCYLNENPRRPFREEDPLGGREPYGASKACAEIATYAFEQSFFEPRRYESHRVAIATVRAGNVIGGGDWGQDRLIPDIVRAFQSGCPALIRQPDAVRPWQHVLEPLSGYLQIARRLLESGTQFRGGWNFGPPPDSVLPVSGVADRCVSLWGGDANWRRDPDAYPAEARSLYLDASRAIEHLGWQPRLALETALELTIDWYRSVARGADPLALCQAQIAAFAQGELT